MKKFNVEIGGSRTVTRSTDNLAGLKRIAKKARGRISVAEGSREIFYGSPGELEFAVRLAQEWGRETLVDKGQPGSNPAERG